MWSGEIDDSRGRTTSFTDSSHTSSTFFTDTKINENGSNIYEATLGLLAGKVGITITQQEYDAVCQQSSTIDSVKKALRAANAEHSGSLHEHRGFHKFLGVLDRIVEPLNRFQSALDTICQSSQLASLIWGSIKFVLLIANNLTSIPPFITESFQELTEALPLYEQYKVLLSDDPHSHLRPPLAQIYVEILTFCVITTRQSQRGALGTVAHTTIKPTDKINLQRCLTNIKRQSGYIQGFAVAYTYAGIEGLRKRLEAIAWLNEQAPLKMPPQTANRRHNNIPAWLSPAFVGRDKELSWLRDTYQSNLGKCCVNRAGIFGMTGIGKTQLMLKYVYDFGETYSDFFYIVAGSESKLLESLQKILDMLDLPEKNKPESHLKVTSVRNHLSETENWLLMIDNIAEEEHQIVMNLLPPKAHGHVIMTSQRAKAVEKITGSRLLCYELKEPELDDAVELFHRSSELRRDDERDKLAKQIVKEVGLLPHAIDQSASYIKENNVNLQEYLDRYHKQPDQILRWEDGYSATRGPVSKHFNLVFQDLAENHVDSLNILRLFSLFEPESIPLFDHWSRDSESCQLFSELAKPKRRFLRSFFCLTFRFSRSPNRVRTNSVPDNCNRVKQVVMSKIRMEKAIAKLQDLSLIRRDSEKLNFWVHDLTRLFVSRTINSADRRAWLETAVEIVYHCFPERDSTSQDQRLVNTYLPQAVSLIRQAEEAKIDLRSYAPLLVICAQCYFARGSYAKALEWLELARPIYEISLGAEHPRTIALEHSIGWNHRESGNPSLAETYHRRTLEARTRVLGSNAPETLESMNDLAAVIERLGKLKEAEDWFTRLYQSQKLTCGPNDPRTKAVAHNLALCYANQGRLAEAEELYWVALRNSEATSESEDLETLKTLGNLAATVNHLGRLADAEVLYDRALAGYNKVFGPDHLLTLRVRSNVSALYREKGRFKEAEQMSKNVLDTFLRLVGPDNFSTAVAMYDYGEVLHENGNLHQAKQYYELAIKVMEVGGPTHPLLFRMIDAMGILQREIGNHSEDENSSKRAYEDNMKLLGWNDPYTLVAANNYAETLQARGYISEAHDLYKKCLEGLTQLLGKEHPHSLMVLNNLGRVSLITGTGDSLQFFSQAHEGFLKLLGEDHACTSTIMLNIARTMWSRGEREKSCSLFSLSIDRQKHALGVSHPHVGVAKYFLAISLASVNELESLNLAKNHLQECIEIFANTLGTEHQNYLIALCVLIRVLHALGEMQEAEGYTSIIQLQSINTTSRKFQTWNGKYYTYKDLLNIDKITIQDTMQILLPWGESIRLRWGRKTCWREAATPKLSG